MAFQTIRKTGQLVGIALTLAAVMIAAVIGIIAVTSSDDTSNADNRAGAAPAASRTPTATPTQASTPTTPPTTSQPAARSTSTTSVAPAPSTSPVANTSPAKRATASTKPKGPITYTVKKGDNLTVIAAWFKQRGYGKLYEQNRKVIGGNPDLILPGQKITVSSAGMTTSR